MLGPPCGGGRPWTQGFGTTEACSPQKASLLGSVRTFACSLWAVSGSTGCPTWTAPSWPSLNQSRGMWKGQWVDTHHAREKVKIDPIWKLLMLYALWKHFIAPQRGLPAVRLMLSDSPLVFASPSYPPAHSAAPGSVWMDDILDHWHLISVQMASNGGVRAHRRFPCRLSWTSWAPWAAPALLKVRLMWAVNHHWNVFSLQEVQHFILVDRSYRFQEGVRQILLGEKRPHPVRRGGALGEWDFWTF